MSTEAFVALAPCVGMWVAAVDESPDGQVVLTLRPKGRPGAMNRYVALSVVEGDGRLAGGSVREGCRLLLEIAAAKRAVEQARGVA